MFGYRIVFLVRHNGSIGADRNDEESCLALSEGLDAQLVGRWQTDFYIFPSQQRVQGLGMLTEAGDMVSIVGGRSPGCCPGSRFAAPDRVEVY